MLSDLVVWLARELVEHKDQVDVAVIDQGRSTIFELTVDQDDLGRVIGRGGRTAKALRSVLEAAGRR